MTDLMADDTFEPDYGDNDESLDKKLDNAATTPTKLVQDDDNGEVESDDGEIKSGTLIKYFFKYF